MHLLSIEMTGFKSFADRTHIDLKQGISAVVGPNGCGKSNIVDAIRWCLGEMSARSLRSKQMLDVIFGGATARSAQNMAEVTLTFDNSHRSLGIDFTEVQVTRRLFRSGESEYFLNKTQCRLKDIRDLFLDTGLSDGYSIMAQGEVDFIINAKPEERREMFEEAAGVSKYKVRRDEAIRKLDRVELDISRLNDVISMVKEQMSALETAAKKAKTYQRLKEELKNLETIDILNRYDQIDASLGDERQKLEQMKLDLSETQVRIDCAQAELIDIRLQSDVLEKALYQKNQDILEFDKSINLSDTQLRTAVEREHEFELHGAREQERINEMQTELVKLFERLEKTKAEISAKQEQVAQLQSNFESENAIWLKIKEEYKTLESRKLATNEAIFSLTNSICEIDNKKNSRSSQLIHEQSGILSLQKDMERAKKEQERYQTEISNLRGKLESLDQLTEVKNSELITLNSNITTQELRYKELNLLLDNLQPELISHKSKLEWVQRGFNTNPYRKGTQAVLDHGFDGLKGVVGLLFKYSENMAHWVEAILGAKLNYLVFAESHQALTALQWLKDNGQGRATCIILDTLPQNSPQDISSMSKASALINLVQCVPELENLKNNVFGHSYLSENILYDKYTIDGGSDLLSLQIGEETPVTENVFRLKAELEESIRNEEDIKEKTQAELAQLYVQIEQSKIMVSEKNMEAGKAHVESLHTKDLVQTKHEELSLAVRELALFEESIALSQRRLEELNSEISIQDQNLNNLESQKTVQEEERILIQKLLDDKKAEEHHSALRVHEHKIRLESTLEALKISQETLNDWHNQTVQIEQNLHGSRTEIENCNTKIAQLTQVQKKEAAAIENLELGKRELTRELETLLNQKSQKEEEIRKKENDVHEAREKLTEYSGAAHALEIELRSREHEKINLASKLQDYYSLSLEEARGLVTQTAIDIDECQRLRKRVESMANTINLEAPVQHEQLAERHGYLCVQMEDLNKAREDIRKAIQQVNSTTREHFIETFTKVQENFRRVYATLFDGGVADLVFTNKENITDTGIDIVAQPMGKKLQNIELLSGGEKALSAIALLFAFFMVKPSPFCVLDEVDAPWDPANVARFIKMLKEFSQKTQFIVVTHNPRTMEIADILYGVTMQEFGISKILSTRLKNKDSDTATPATPDIPATIPSRQEESTDNNGLLVTIGDDLANN